ncbi:YeeE/YedE thiosulfate transporter family protein [Clostridium sp. HMP27]|uniref:YeeE/YedE thiosulfate transporter family protein n=1 Tax=Clostridium sp. HMP27 TaxID=1487921 RepID=UPI00052CEB6C|nr:YeeE/YedE thiosulfate transporter family protein [Clostridium sp. HMP27]KGK81721.1 transporter [Clostridium sp. HMP27]
MANEIDMLIQKRNDKGGNKKNQIPYAIIVFIISIVICIILWKLNQEYIAYWILGISIGIVLRYSRFCFSAAIRDPLLIGNVKLLKAMLLGMMVSTLGFAVIQYLYFKGHIVDYTYIPGSVTSWGIHIMIGAFLFGIGMTIAGGCASGVLMRIGEGHALQWIVLLGFFIGSTLGIHDYPFWYDHIIKNTKIIYFPQYVDLKVVVVVQMFLLMMIYKGASKYEKALRDKFWRN